MLKTTSAKNIRRRGKIVIAQTIMSLRSKTSTSSQTKAEKIPLVTAMANLIGFLIRRE